MKKFIEEFKSFALRGNVMDMAVGVIIGGAFSGIVTSLTDNFITPILKFITGAETYDLQDVAGFASSFVSALVNFFIMALVLFCLLKVINKLMKLGRKKEEAAAPAFDIAELKPGQHVMHRPWNKKAVVREVDARQNRVKLDMNGVTLWADAALLGPADAPQQQAKPKSGVLVRTTAGSDPEISLLRLDLRGKRADQALGELSQYLDRALLSGREGVEIVHGRGTGALRKEVHAFLKTFPGIASFALAPEDQGGDGVTIVTFK